MNAVYRLWSDIWRGFIDGWTALWDRFGFGVLGLAVLYVEFLMVLPAVTR